MIAKAKTTRHLPGAFGTTATLGLLALTLVTAPAQDRVREGEKDIPEVREREGDREKPEAQKDDGAREKPSVREGEKLDGDARRPEIRDGEHAELMRAREQEIRAAREEIGRLAREGKKEEAERLEAQVRQKLERLRVEGGDRGGAERPNEGDIDHLRAEIGRLTREGKHDQAEQLEQRLRAKLGERAGEGRVTDRPTAEVRPGNPEELRRQLTELTELVRGMQRSMNEIREELHHLREERKSAD